MRGARAHTHKCRDRHARATAAAAALGSFVRSFVPTRMDWAARRGTLGLGCWQSSGDLTMVRRALPVSAQPATHLNLDRKWLQTTLSCSLFVAANKFPVFLAGWVFVIT